MIWKRLFFKVINKYCDDSVGGTVDQWKFGLNFYFFFHSIKKVWHSVEEKKKNSKIGATHVKF